MQKYKLRVKVALFRQRYWAALQYRHLVVLSVNYKYSSHSKPPDGDGKAQPYGTGF